MLREQETLDCKWPFFLQHPFVPPKELYYGAGAERPLKCEPLLPAFYLLATAAISGPDKERLRDSTFILCPSLFSQATFSKKKKKN